MAASPPASAPDPAGRPERVQCGTRGGRGSRGGRAADRDGLDPKNPTVRGAGFSALLPLVIHGAGGHGAVVAEAASLAGLTVLGFLDRDDRVRPGLVTWTSAADLPQEAAIHVAVGDAATRERLSREHSAAGRRLASIVHPRAFVSPSASLSPDSGVFVGPLAVVHAGCRVEAGAILNTACVLEHDGRLGPFSHLGPGAVTGGAVAVGARALVGLGARLAPGVRVGDDARVGAGAIVLRNVAPGETAVGVVK